jgi:hypothetical protein
MRMVSGLGTLNTHEGEGRKCSSLVKEPPLSSLHWKPKKQLHSMTTKRILSEGQKVFNRDIGLPTETGLIKGILHEMLKGLG